MTLDYGGQYLQQKIYFLLATINLHVKHSKISFVKYSPSNKVISYIYFTKISYHHRDHSCTDYIHYTHPMKVVYHWAKPSFSKDYQWETRDVKNTWNCESFFPTASYIENEQWKNNHLFHNYIKYLLKTLLERQLYSLYLHFQAYKN